MQDFLRDPFAICFESTHAGREELISDCMMFVSQEAAGYESRIAYCRPACTGANVWLGPNGHTDAFIRGNALTS